MKFYKELQINKIQKLNLNLYFYDFSDFRRCGAKIANLHHRYYICTQY